MYKTIYISIEAPAWLHFLGELAYYVLLRFGEVEGLVAVFFDNKIFDLAD
jgi:hypothetical protein